MTADQAERLEVVLVSPRNPLNIGAVARAMANFGLSRLTVVTPWAPSWRDARSAVGAPQLLENARETAVLAEAVAASTLVIGTGCLTFRKPDQPIVSLPDLAPRVGRELRAGGRVSLLFGSEKHGLTREDLEQCHLLAVIPTHPAQPSMNLGQAAAVCLYELATRLDSAASAPQPAPETVDAKAFAEPPSASTGHLNLLAGLIEETMLLAGYSPRSMQAANHHDLQILLRRLAPDAADTRRMLGLFRRILWRLRRSPNRT